MDCCNKCCLSFLTTYAYKLRHKLHSTGLLKKNLVIFLISAISLCACLPGFSAAPQGSCSHTNDNLTDPETQPLVHHDDENNIYFDMYVLRGKENKIMMDKEGVLIVSIQSPDDMQDTFENALWTFITSVLGVTKEDVEILLFPSDAVRRVLLKKSRRTDKECEDKIRDILKPYIPLPGQSPDQTETPPYLPPFDQVAIYAHNDSTQREGPLKYYELTFSQEVKSSKKTEPIPRKKLIELKPYYARDPSWMAKILRDIKPNTGGVVIRGRLLPGVPQRPVVDDYRGSKKVKLTRKMLQGIAEGSGVEKPRSKLRLEMSHPVPGQVMLDFLSPDKSVVVSRRVINPFFRNDTVEIVEEFEYVEVL